MVEIKKCKKQKKVGKPVKQKTRNLPVDWRACTTLITKLQPSVSGVPSFKKVVKNVESDQIFEIENTFYSSHTKCSRDGTNFIFL